MLEYKQLTFKLRHLPRTKELLIKICTVNINIKYHDNFIKCVIKLINSKLLKFKHLTEILNF